MKWGFIIVEFNTEQNQAISSKSKRICCLAGAGAGKTKTLIARIERLISDGVQPESIIAFTFTNAAANEMLQRYLSGHSEDTMVPEFTTFHAFCYRLICSDGELRSYIGYNSLPTIISEEFEKSYINDLAYKLGYKPKENPKNIKEQKQAEKFNEILHKNLCMDGYITFDRLQKSIVDLFISDDELVFPYKFKYQHILVDEFQDTDNFQWQFIQSFKDSAIFVCGDVLQNLYSFRGTDNTILKELSESDDWEVIKMRTNYRSDKAICAFANSMSTYADDSYRIELKPNSQFDGKVVVYNNGIENPFIDPDEDVLREFISDYKPDSLYKSYAILCRTNREVDYIKQQFPELGKNRDSSRIANSLKFCNLWNIVKSNKQTISYLLAQLNTDDYFACMNYYYSNTLSDTKFISYLGNLDKLQDISSNIEIIKSYVTEIESKDFNLVNCIDTMNDCLYRMYFNQCILIPYERIVGAKNDDILLQQFENLLKSTVDSSSVHIGTIHSAKGLEWDSVYIPGVNSKSFRLDCEDNLNLYYVAITRAKCKLTVGIHKEAGGFY